MATPARPTPPRPCTRAAHRTTAGRRASAGRYGAAWSFLRRPRGRALDLGALSRERHVVAGDLPPVVGGEGQRDRSGGVQRAARDALVGAVGERRRRQDELPVAVRQRGDHHRLRCRLEVAGELGLAVLEQHALVGPLDRGLGAGVEQGRLIVRGRPASLERWYSVWDTVGPTPP